MTLETLNADFGKGGAGLSDGKLKGIITELQGLRQSVATGGTANSKIAIAAIRAEDTILSVLDNNAGTIADITSTVSIYDIKANGTLTVGTVVAGDIATVNGLAYTLVANDTVIAAGDYSKVLVGADADECATNLAAAITARELEQTTPKVSASAATNVVTITALAEGAAGNAITLAETGTTLTKSGTTLSGGSDTGGVSSTDATHQIIMLWYNKR